MVRVPLPAETSVFLSSRSKSAKLPVFVNRFADPIDPWVITDCIVSRINQDYLKVFVCRILEDSSIEHQKMKVKLSLIKIEISS